MSRSRRATLSDNAHPHTWRSRVHEVIFESHTTAGKAFDILLIGMILLSVIVVMLESVKGIRSTHGQELLFLEWFFTVAFSIELILRLISLKRPILYIFSFYGLVDILAILPTYLGLLLPGVHYLLVIRILRLLRVFRIFRLTEFIGEADAIRQALGASMKKILVFILFVLSLVIIMGSLMYVIEGEENGFTDIPNSIYWAVVTLTTVGYGDISPHTPLGKFFAAIVMMLGYAVIAVPTGIVTAEFTRSTAGRIESVEVCPACGMEGHDRDAVFCKHCGEKIV